MGARRPVLMVIAVLCASVCGGALASAPTQAGVVHVFGGEIRRRGDR